MSKSIEELEAIIAKGRAVVLDFMPNIKNCVLQNYGQLNEFLLESRPQEKSVQHLKWKCPACGSPDIQISLPTWFHEYENGSLEMVEPDAEADIKWFYCETCDFTDDGEPSLAKE